MWHLFLLQMTSWIRKYKRKTRVFIIALSAFQTVEKNLWKLFESSSKVEYFCRGLRRAYIRNPLMVFNISYASDIMLPFFHTVYHFVEIIPLAKYTDFSTFYCFSPFPLKLDDLQGFSTFGSSREGFHNVRTVDWLGFAPVILGSQMVLSLNVMGNLMHWMLLWYLQLETRETN